MSNKPQLVVGLHGTRGAGKDTLFSHLANLNPHFRRFAFADALKEQIAPMVREHMGYDSWNLTPEQKEVVRHAWIGWGMAMRAHDPLYWVKRAVSNISHASQSETIWPVLCDCRFINEVNYLRSEYGDRFILIDITRFDSPEPTDEEKKHYRQVAAMADYHLCWGGETPEQQLARAREVYVRLGDWIIANAMMDINASTAAGTRAIVKLNKAA